MLLYIYAIECTPLPNLHPESFKWNRYITCFCANEKGELVVLVMRFRPFILMRVPDPHESLKEDYLQHLANGMDKHLFGNYSNELKVEIDRRIPFLGFANSIKHDTFRLYYKSILAKNKILKHLEEHGLGTLDASEKVTIYHQNGLNANKEKVRFGVKEEEELFRVETGLRSHTWVEFDTSSPQLVVHKDPKSVCHNLFMCYEQVDAISLTMQPLTMLPPPLTVAYLSGIATSGTATIANQYTADANNADDIIPALCLIIHKIGSEPQKFILTTI